MDRTRFAFAFFVVLALIGCVSDRTTKPSIERSANTNSKPIYATLEKTPSGYRFTTFSTSYDRSGPWVRLNDGSPMWSTKLESTCSIGTAGDKVRCKTEDEKLFRTFSTGVSRTALLSVLTLGYGLTQPIGDVVFDEDAYKKALDEANAAQGDRSPLAAIMSLIESKEQERNMYSVGIKNFIGNVEKKVTVVDNSGFFKREIDFADLATVAGIALPNLKHHDATSLDGLLKSIQQDYEELTYTWKRSVGTVTATCKASTPRKNIHFDMECPNVTRAEDGRTVIPIKVTVLARDFQRVMPATFQASDEILQVMLENGRLRVVNRSSSYVSIDSISVYYNGKIASLSKLGRELSPRSESVVANIGDFPINWNTLDFPRMTRMSASKKEIEYGLAVKYRTANVKEKTLYRAEKRRLLDMLVAQL